MNSPMDDLKAAAAAKEAKTLAWLKIHWYSFAIGGGCGLALAWILKMLGKVF